MPTRTVLVAEDELLARTALIDLLEAEHFRVLSANNGPEALSLLLHEEPDAALLDIRMPGMNGLDVLKHAREGGCDTPMIIMTAHGDSASAIDAMRLGAFDYVAKPLDFQTVLPQLRRAVENRRLTRESRTGEVLPRPTLAMVGNSPAMQHVYKLIGQVAKTDATVLVRGESGTGKELVVNAIHHNSARAKGPLVKVNCASIPEALLESELFGHEKGAFTNALFRRIGRFEDANRGTLFLDEIAELPIALQAKLLRAIQERTIERLGSNTTVRVDLRLITATAKNLEQAVSNGDFREDLYYRLNVVAIQMPPLRERSQDIPSLVDHFLHRGPGRISMTSGAMQKLCAHPWPGNVRELENAVERARVLSPGEVIDETDIVLQPRNDASTLSWMDNAPLQQGMKANVAALEKALIRRAMAQAEGNKSKAAELLGIHRRLLYEKIHEHQLEKA